MIAGSAGYAEFLVKNCTFELINYIQNLCMRSSRQLFELKNIKSKVIYVRLKVIYVRLKVIYVRPKVIYVRLKSYMCGVESYMCGQKKLCVRRELYMCGPYYICAGSNFIY